MLSPSAHSDLPMVRLCGPSGGAVFVTWAWLDFAGRSRDEELGFGWMDRIHGDDREVVVARLRQAVQGGGPIELEYRLRRRDGEYARVTDTAEPQHSADGEVVGLVSTVVPVVERGASLLSEQALRESEVRYGTLLDSIDEGFSVVEVIFDEDNTPTDYRFVEINHVFEEQTGLKDPLGKTARELVPDLDEFWFATYGAVALTGEPLRFENYAPAMGRWFDVNTFRLGPAEHRRVGSLFKDITSRKQADEELRYRGEQFETLLNHAPLGVYLVDAAFRIAQVNPVALPVFGDVPDLIGRDFEEVIHMLWQKETADEVAALFRRTLETGEPHHAPERAEYRADRGAVEHYQWQINRITLPDGRYGVVCYFSDISQQMRAREAIGKSEERYRTLFNSIDEGFCILQLIFDEKQKPIDYRYIEINPVFEKQTGMKDALGRTIRELVPGIEPFWFDIYGRVALTGEATRFVDHAESMGRWFDVYAFRVGAPEERRVAVLFKDITAEKQSEQALRESEARFRAMADGLPLIVWVHDEEGKQEFVNRTFCEFFGVSMEECRGDGWQMLMHPDDAEAYAAEFLSCTREQRPFHAEVRVHDAEGRWRWLESWGQPRFSPSGDFLGFVGTSADVTHQKGIEESLRAQGRELEAALELNRMITDSAYSCLFMMDREGHATFMNPAAERATGFTLEEIRSERLHYVLHHHRPDGSVYPADECLIENANEAGEDIRYFEELFIRKDGAFFPVSGSTVSIARLGVHQGSLLEFRDLSDVREAEEALQRSEHRFRIITNVIPQLVWIADASGEVTYFNDGWYEYTGQCGDEALGRGWAAAIHPDDRRRIEKSWQHAVETQQRYETEYRIRRHDGQYRWHIGRGMPLLDWEGRVATWFGTCTDIDQMKQTEDELRRANAVKDDFLSLVSHELRTPLTTIVGLTRLLSRGASKLSEEDRESVDFIVRDSERLQTLIENLLILARVDRKDVELEPLRLPQLVNRVVSAHGEQHPERRVETVIEPGLPIVEGQGVWVEQVLKNGLSNAEKYSSKDEPITIRVHPEGHQVVVQVIDRGPGMGDEELERIFEPFYRSPDAVRSAIPGAGLGLSICRRLVELQGGTIRARAAETGGLLFEFTLPAAREE